MCADFWKGMGAGLAVGIGLGLLMRPRKKCHSAAKLIRAAGDAVERMGNFFGA